MLQIECDGCTQGLGLGPCSGRDLALAWHRPKQRARSPQQANSCIHRACRHTSAQPSESSRYPRTVVVFHLGRVDDRPLCYLFVSVSGITYTIAWKAVPRPRRIPTRIPSTIRTSDCAGMSRANKLSTGNSFVQRPTCCVTPTPTHALAPGHERASAIASMRSMYSRHDGFTTFIATSACIRTRCAVGKIVTRAHRFSRLKVAFDLCVQAECSTRSRRGVGRRAHGE